MLVLLVVPRQLQETRDGARARTDGVGVQAPKPKPETDPTRPTDRPTQLVVVREVGLK